MYKIFYLIGMMGSGKSTIGKKLAEKLQMDFIDLDDLIEETNQSSIVRIFEEHGHDYFRKIETDTLINIIPKRNTIISTGGGTPCFNDNIHYMNDNGITIFMEVSVVELAKRLENDKMKRPLINTMDKDNITDYVRKTKLQRSRYYFMAKEIVSYDLDTKNFEHHVMELISKHLIENSENKSQIL
jgi:shikimate kinase